MVIFYSYVVSLPYSRLLWSCRRWCYVATCGNHCKSRDDLSNFLPSDSATAFARTSLAVLVKGSKSSRKRPQIPGDFFWWSDDCLSCGRWNKPRKQVPLLQCNQVACHLFQPLMDFSSDPDYFLRSPNSILLELEWNKLKFIKGPHSTLR